MRMTASQLFLVNNLSRLDIDFELIEIVAVARAQKSLDHGQSRWVCQRVSSVSMLCIQKDRHLGLGRFRQCDDSEVRMLSWKCRPDVICSL